jgi:hypothetical protein
MSVRVASRRSIGCAIVGATLAILAGVCAGGASAHFQTYPYTLTACPASYEHQVDPVTDVFYGAATGARVLNHIRFHTGWTDAGGSTQYFSSEGVCGAMYGRLASGSVLQSRFHIRIRRTYDDDPVWGITARGDAHHEDFVWYCGHAVDKGGVSTGLASGFDKGGGRSTTLFPAPTPTVERRTGATRASSSNATAPMRAATATSTGGGSPLGVTDAKLLPTGRPRASRGVDACRMRDRHTGDVDGGFAGRPVSH